MWPEAVVENVWPGPRLVGGYPDLAVLFNTVDRLHPSRACCDKNGDSEILSVDMDDQRSVFRNRRHQPTPAGVRVVDERLADVVGVSQSASVISRKHCHALAL